MRKRKLFKIGNLKIKNRVFLAPMHNVNDIAFRELCKKAGAGLCWTELTNPRTKQKLDLGDKPALQLVCNTPKGIKEFIQTYDKKVSLYDLNLGCPSTHAKQSKTGYFMISEYYSIEDILNTIRKNTKKPLTIKIRKMPYKNTKRILKIAEKYCDAVAIHPRTCKQGYSGMPDIDYARKIKEMTNLPLIYSGNITNKETSDNLLKEFEFIMIGRASIGNPPIFSELLNKKKKKIDFNDYLKLARKHKLYKNLQQIKFQAINFTRGMENSRKLRKRLSNAKNLSQIKELFRFK